MLRERMLGRSKIPVSALGLGCWAIGGAFWENQTPLGWGQVNDIDSTCAIFKAITSGINFFDTSDLYGAGHSECLLGSIIERMKIRHKIIIATKFGWSFDEKTKQKYSASTSPEYIQRACEASLRRLQNDYIDLYQFHVAGCDLEQALCIRDKVEDLAHQGKIRFYGWSTRTPDRALLFAKGEHWSAIQFPMNVLAENDQMLKICHEHNVAAIFRAPLAMGLLSGKYTSSSLIPDDDVRGPHGLPLDFFSQGKPNVQQLAKIQKIKSVLLTDGRTLAQGALAWLWAKSEEGIPIPGFKNVDQVIENIGALKFGALTKSQMEEISNLLN